MSDQTNNQQEGTQEITVPQCKETTVQEKLSKGLLNEVFTRSNSDVRKNRAKNACTILETKLTLLVQNYHMELEELALRQLELFDLNPNNTTSTKFDINSDAIIEELQEITLSEIKVRVVYDALKAKYELLLGKAFVPSVSSLSIQ